MKLNRMMMQLKTFRKELEQEEIRCTYSMVEKDDGLRVFFTTKGDYDETERSYSILLPETCGELEAALLALKDRVRRETRKRPEPETGFVVHKVRIIMYDGDDLENGEDWYEFEVMTRDTVSAEEVGLAFSQDQAKLERVGNALYYNCGKTPDTLAEYVCRRRGWHWRRMKYDVTVHM